MKKIAVFIVSLFVFSVASSQDSVKVYKKGSYLFYGQPNIEDNSMFIEEAFNQEGGVIQHISNFIFDKGSLIYSYTQEIPMPNEKTQLSFTLLYNVLKAKPIGAPSNNGIGDMLINYRPMLMNKSAWALVIPRFTLIIPTGNSKYGYGSGAWGGQFNMAVTKRVTSKLTTHWNAGFTKLFKEDHVSEAGEILLEKNHTSYNVGASAIYLVNDSFNLMCEYVSGFNQTFNDTGNTVNVHDMTINPGFRFAFSTGRTQVVPGLGIPFNFQNGKHVSTGAFLYLSIEPNYFAK